ncbi:hypothetical protein AND_009000 [Anopheles darlingi]|uniref:Uncharacterized protein n=1 Tax=Anopheles darlingi TaxID=43151 RepID=W5J980_ANODA|nr:hypothetical protein AND_009000 [Anopheles darlingi]
MGQRHYTTLHQQLLQQHQHNNNNTHHNLNPLPNPPPINCNRATLGQGIRTGGGTVIPISSGIGMMTPGASASGVDRRNTGSLRDRLRTVKADDSYGLLECCDEEEEDEEE